MFKREKAAEGGNHQKSQPQEEFEFYKENEQKILVMRPELYFRRTALAIAV